MTALLLEKEVLEGAELDELLGYPNNNNNKNGSQQNGSDDGKEKEPESGASPSDKEVAEEGSEGRAAQTNAENGRDDGAVRKQAREIGAADDDDPDDEED